MARKMREPNILAHGFLAQGRSLSEFEAAIAAEALAQAAAEASKCAGAELERAPGRHMWC